MAGFTTNISIRMDSVLNAQGDALFGELGMNLSTAFNVFVCQSLRALEAGECLSASKKDFKPVMKCGLKIRLPEEGIATLAMAETLPERNN